MKRYLLAVLLFFAVTGSYAQSLSFEDLLNLTNMTSAQVHDFLTISKGFKSAGTQIVDGKSIEQYKSNRGTPDKVETIALGVTAKGAGGNSSRPVTYSTLQDSDINSLLTQAKKSTLTLVFQGSDLYKNIFRFDNSLFRASISLSFDKKSGSVEVQQKE
jgi:hypothetical protein